MTEKNDDWTSPEELRTGMLALGWPPEMIDREVARQAKAIELSKQYPDLPGITLTIMAGDMASIDWVHADVVAGKVDPVTAPHLVGSYARCEYALRLREEGFLTEDQLLENWPDYWRSGDPDDTDPRFLAVWQRAAAREPGGYVRDGKALPKGRSLMAYRGTQEGQPLGVSWSLSKKVAEAFARGAGLRTAAKNPGVMSSWVERFAILAYLTGRNEEELIINPEYFKDAVWERKEPKDD